MRREREDGVLLADTGVVQLRAHFDMGGSMRLRVWGSKSPHVAGILSAKDVEALRLELNRRAATPGAEPPTKGPTT